MTAPMSEREPYLRIVRGDATPEEVAAVVAAITSRAPRVTKAVQKAENWRNPAHRMRGALPRGPGAWRASSFPGSR